MADAAAIGVGEATAIEELRRQSRRVEAAERRLRMSGIGQPEAAHATIATNAGRRSQASVSKPSSASLKYFVKRPPE